jgi:predicted phosphoadenosine phosphosulfate sulfurtransferase
VLDNFDDDIALKTLKKSTQNNTVPILAIFTRNNITKQMYEALRKEVNREQDDPAGVILHASGFDDSGNNVRVADIWESDEELNNFVANRLMPVMQKAGVPAPKVEICQINDVSAYPGIDRYRVR